MSSNKKILPVAVVAIIAIAGAGYYLFKGDSVTDAMSGAENVVTKAENVVGNAADGAKDMADKAADAVKDTANKVSSEKAEAATQALTDDQIEVEPGNPVIAIVDGKEITRVDVYRFIQTMPPQMQQLPATTVYPMAVEQVINTRIIQNKANNADVSKSEKFQKEMEMAKQQIARNLFLEEAVAKDITDSKLKKLYADLSKKTPDVEERRARHILLETEEKAKAVIKQLKAGGDFQGLAKELSVGPTAPKGGDLGYFAKTDMVPEFANKAFSMDKNSITDTPVKTQFGYHVIQLVDVRQRPKPTMDQVKPALEAELRREVLNEKMAEWRKSAKIEQFDINGKPLKDGANATGMVPPKVEPAAE